MCGNDILTNDLLTRIEEFTGEDNILFISLGGSLSWHSKLSSDADIVVVSKSDLPNNLATISTKINGIDVFIKSFNFYKMRDDHAYIDYKLSNLYQDNILFGHIPEDMFDNADVFHALYLWYSNQHRGYWKLHTNNMCVKSMYWGFMLYYAALNNGSVEFLEEQRDIIQKCHDLQLPILYRDQLKENIKNILQEQN